MSASSRRILAFGILFTWTLVLTGTNGKPASRDEIRITPLNRDACLAKLICGMTVGSKIENRKEDQLSYSQYALILDQFVKENPVEEPPSEESLELLEDYSVSVEDLQPSQKPRRPSITPKLPSLHLSPEPTAETMVSVELAARPQLGEGSKESNSTKAELEFRERNAKLIKDVQSKLKAVRECKNIPGCSYTFKSLVQRYSGKKIPSAAPPLEVYAPSHAMKHTWFLPENEKFSEDLADDESIEDEPTKPVLGGFLQADTLSSSGYFNPPQPAPYKLKIKKRNRPNTQTVTTHVRQQQRGPQIKRNPRPTPTAPPRVQQKYRPRPLRKRKNKKPVRQYKVPTSSQNKRPIIKNYADEDEDDDVNKTAPLELVGNPEVDHRSELNGSNDESEQDDYDEEAKDEVSTEYGDDDDEEKDDEGAEDEDDDEELTRKEKKTKKNKKSSNSNSVVIGQSPNNKLKEIEATKPAFPAAEPRKKKDKTEDIDVVKRNEKKDDEDSSAAEDDDAERESAKYRDTVFLTQIGGRPIFPSSDIPISMTFGSSRPKPHVFSMGAGISGLAPSPPRRESYPPPGGQKMTSHHAPQQPSQFGTMHSHQSSSAMNHAPQNQGSSSSGGLSSWGISIAPIRNLFANGLGSNGQGGIKMFSKPVAPPPGGINMFSSSATQGGQSNGANSYRPAPSTSMHSAASMAGVKFPPPGPESAHFRKSPVSSKNSKASKSKPKRSKGSKAARRRISSAAQQSSDPNKSEKKYKLTKNKHVYLV